MRKKQKIKSKKQSQRSFRAFISIVNWYKNKFDIALYISNIYGNEYQKKEVNIHKLPMWRDITQVQKLAYFFYFMAETKKFTNIKPFTLDLSKPFRDKYNNLTYKKLKAVIIKRIYGNLDYIFIAIINYMTGIVYKLFLSINVSYNQYLVKTQA